MRKTPPISFYLDTRRKLDNGLYRLKLRVTFTRYVGDVKKWDQKYFPTDLAYASDSEYQKILHSKTKSSHPDYKTMRKLEAKANDIVETNPYISPELFSTLYTGEYVRSADLVQLYEQRIREFLKADQHASADTYTYALKSFQRFSSSLNLHAIDVEWLVKYEGWAKKKGKQIELAGGTLTNKTFSSAPMSVTTIGIYLVTLRAIFNIAIDKKIISKDHYPFGKKKYIIPKSNNFKKALDQTDKKKLLQFEAISKKEEFYHAMWCFSYYCNGMNMVDIAYLRPENIDDNVLTYIRRKSYTTERNQTPMVIPLRNEVISVIERFGNKRPYLFGVITEADNPAKKRLKIKYFVRNVNKYVRSVSKRLNIKTDVKTYVARHTVATTLIEAGADLRDVKETMGHSSFSTTQRYINSIDINRKKKLVEML